LAALLAVYLMAAPVTRVDAFGWLDKITVDVTDDRPDYVSVDTGREFEYDDGEVRVKLRVSGTARLAGVEYGSDADVYDAGAGFAVLVPRETKVDSGAAVELSVEKLGPGDKGYDDVMAETANSYGDVYSVVGLKYRFSLDGHELDMSGCTVEAQAGWTEQVLEDAADRILSDDETEDVSEDVGVAVSVYAVGEQGAELAAGTVVDMDEPSVVQSDVGMMDVQMCMAMEAVERVEADIAILPEDDVPMADAPGEKGLWSNMVDTVADFFGFGDGEADSEVAGDQFEVSDDESDVGEDGSSDIEDEPAEDMVVGDGNVEDNGPVENEESVDGTMGNAPNGGNDDTNGENDGKNDTDDKSDAWIVVDEFGTWLVVGVGANPEYNVQYWAWLPVVDKSGGTGARGSLNVINTTGKSLPVNGKGSNSPTDNALQGLKVSGDGTLETVNTFKEIYASEKWLYQKKPQMVYIDKVSSNKNRQTNYKLAAIWVLKTSKDASTTDKKGDSTAYGDWDIYALEDMYKLDLDAVGSGSSVKLKDPSGSSFDARLIRDLSQVKFTSDINNEHLGHPVEDGVLGGKIYYVLIGKASVIRLVYEPISKVELPAADGGVPVKVDKMALLKGTFYDYDIEGVASNKMADLPEGRQDRAVGRVEYKNEKRALNGYGINDVFYNCGEDAVTDTSRIFAFGNAFGTGLWREIYDGNRLNRGNVVNPNDRKVFRSYMGCTFGLVKSLSPDGYVQYADGLVVPNLFNEVDDEDRPTSGKKSYEGSDFTFRQVGDTYTLSKVKVSDEKASELVDLDKLHNPKCGKDTWTHIWTNDFWPLDNVDAFDPMTGEVNNTGKVAGYTWGAASDQNYTDDWKGYGVATYNTSDDGKAHNNFFGLHYSVDFELTDDYTGPLEYLFFGDDDMWVFLSELVQTGVDEEGKPVFSANEGELVCDIGGVHSSVGEYVDLWDYVGKDREGTHRYRLSFFYTERGASGSTCYMQFTLPSVSQILDARPYAMQTAVTVSKQVGEVKSETSVDLSTDASVQDEKFTFTLFFQDDAGNPIKTDNGAGWAIGKNGKLPDYNDAEALTSFEYKPQDPPEHISDVYQGILGDQVGCRVELAQGDSVTVFGLEPNTKYYVIEERTDGYDPAVMINGSLNSDGTVSKDEDGMQKWQYGDNVVQGQLTGTQAVKVTYVNQPVPDGYEFPATGGMGVVPFYTAGCAMVVAAGLFLFRKRRTDR